MSLSSIESRSARASNDVDNLVDLLRARARAQPTKVAYVFLDDGEREGARLTFGELDRRARAIAAQLSGKGTVGGRALLLYPPGLPYIEAFFGCLYAGVVAVPAYPPTGRHFDRLRSIVVDSRPSMILTTEAMRLRYEAGEEMTRVTGEWIATDRIDTALAADWRPIAPASCDIAFLQYTSGSTADPRGVMISHANLLSNQALIAESFGHDGRSDLVGWLPLYHDMGLIGNVLQPMYIGATAYLMSPMAFLEKPLRWLKAISHYRAQTSGGPNFAYDLCARKIKPEDRQGLDLASWRIAFSGAEPVRAQTLDRFARAFAECGFRRDSFTACYGLAEATLVVTAPKGGRSTPVIEIDRCALESGRALRAATKRAMSFVGCGQAWSGYEVAIVDPESAARCRPGGVGEVWVAGPGVARGYWGKPEDSARVFEARIAGEEDRVFLRTGDLGFFDNGELFIAGRLKDLIIVAGRNVHAHDVETTIEQRVKGLRAGCTAAFSVTRADEERLVVVAEADRAIASDESLHGEILAQIRRCVGEDLGVEPAHVVLTRSGSVPKTSSGKLRRAECRRLLLADELPIVALWDRGDATDDERKPQAAAPQRAAFLRQALTFVEPDQRRAMLRRFLLTAAAETLEAPAGALSDACSFAQAGLSSLRAIELKHRIDAALDIEAPIALLLSDASIDAAADALLRLVDGASDTADDLRREEGAPRLSCTQSAMWTVHRLEGASEAYNLHLALRVDASVDLERLRRAVGSLVERHAQLRTIYRPAADGATAEPAALSSAPEIARIEPAAHWSESELRAAMAEEARRPFAIESEAPLRVVLYGLAKDRCALLFVAHHIAIDQWSLGLLLEELDRIYRSASEGLDDATADYADFVAGESRYLGSAAAEEDWSYWRRRLAGPLPILELPLDRRRTAGRDYRGGSVPLILDQSKTQRLKAFAKSEGASLHAVLLTVYFALLRRLCGQDDIIVGGAASGRLDRSVARLVGNCVNPVAIRAQVEPGASFVDLLRRVSEEVKGAIVHQRLPFQLLVERLNPERAHDRWPIYQTWFVLQQAQAGVQGPAAALALGEEIGAIELLGGTARPVALRERVEMFDLKVTAAEHDGRVALSFQFSEQAFHRATIVTMARRFERLVEALLESPESRIGEAPIIEDAERRAILSVSSGAAAPASDALLPSLLGAGARSEEIAVASADGSLTYGELDRRSNRVARLLQREGVGPEQVVGVCLEPSVDYVVSVLGVLKAGGAFLPLDPAYPPERLRYMLEDSKARALISTRAARRLGCNVRELFVAPEDLALWSDDPVVSTAHPDALAYVVYTSGSTGRAKGVMATHRNAVASLAARLRFYEERVADFLLLSPLSFDSSFAGLFWSLASGGRLHLVSEAARRDPVSLREIIAGRSISHLLCLPSFYRELLATLGDGSGRSLRCCIVAGEACGKDVVERHFRALPTAALFNEYGPTECAVWCAAEQIRGEHDVANGVGIGSAIPGARAYVLDESGELAPLGVVGELCVAGAGVARGYLARPELTAERFLPDPYGFAGARLYRTGDRARYRADGRLEFLGRGDEQVKIRGHRVEIAEVEDALSRIALVREAAVVARADSSGDKRLIAYVAGAEGLDPRAVKEAFRREAPDHMTPHFIVPLASLPRLENGKIDRKALPEPDLASLIEARYVAPTTERQIAVCAAFGEILGLVRVGAADDFFDLGGDSIRAIQAASALRARGYEATPRMFFEHPTAAALAERLRPLDASVSSAPSPDSVASPFALAQLGAARIAELKALHGDIADIYPLTPMQEGMLLHTLAQQGTGLYLMQDRYEIKGALDASAFAEAWRRVIARHDILRTSFDWSSDGRPHQIVHREAQLSFEAIDLRARGDGEQTAVIDEALAIERAEGFDLAQAPLMRIRLYRVADDRHICVRSFHHIILDDWCTSPLILDVRRHYAALRAGAAASFPKAPQFRSYIDWISARSSASAERFWRSYLDGFVEPTPLVGAKRVSDGAASIVEDIVVDLPDDLYRRLETLVQQRRLTLNTFVQGALALSLARTGGVDDVVFGVTVSGRPIDLPGADATLGLFINSLPLRVRIDPRMRVVDWLRRILSDNLDIRQYEFVAQTDIQRWSAVSRSHALLFQHLLTFENAPLDPSVRGEKDVLDIDLLQLRVHTNYPLTFVAVPGDRLSLRLTYDRERFDPETARRTAEGFRRALERLIVDFDGRLCDLELLPRSEVEAVTRSWNATERDFGAPLDFLARFEARAAADADRVAACCDGASVRYGELNARANRLAHVLIEAGVGPDSIVALLDDRGIGFLVAILAIFKAGGAYLPLDPAHPDGRIAQVLLESAAPFLAAGASHLLRARSLATMLGEPAPRTLDLEALAGAGSSSDVPARRHSPANLAFVIYTSGSTGTPKGAMVEHRGMFNNLVTKIPALSLTKDDAIAQTASQCFDISVWQLLTALTIGARVEIFPDTISREPQRLAAAIHARGVTILEAVPSMIGALLDVEAASAALAGLRWLLPCGEAFAPDLCRRVMERFPHLRLLNAYGPAECSDDVSYHAITSPPKGNELSVPIGRPVDNARLYVLDQWLEPAPIGSAGEICVAGVQVGRGYLHRPELTAASFVPDPFGGFGERLYRTGDLGRWSCDGVLDFLGRADHQVKIRGHRIELGEIDAKLTSHPKVRAACVDARKIGERGARLVAYVACAAEDFAPDELRAHLRAVLPDFMIPDLFVRLDALPLTGNGKVDRKALPAPEAHLAGAAAAMGARTPTEETIAEIWKNLLGAPHVSPSDNFYELGGDSLLATRIASRIRSIFAIELPLRDLLEARDLAALAARVDAARGGGSARDVGEIARAPREGGAPLSNAQQRLWFMQTLDPSTSAYNLSLAARATGPLDDDLVEATLNRLVRRHEALRTLFVVEDGAPRQKILPELVVARRSKLVSGAVEAAGDLLADMRAVTREPFDLETGPLIRCTIYRSMDAGEASAIVLLSFHHIIFDGWSYAVLLRDFAEIYSALHARREPSLPELSIQYADYAAWDAERQRGDTGRAQLAYWREHLQGAPPRLDLPTDHPRTASTGYLAGTYGVDLFELTEALERFDRERAVTPFMTMLSAYAVLLAHLGGASDLVIGANVANRPRAELEQVIGYFVNQVALRIRLERDPSFDELVERVRGVTLASYDHETFPFDRLVEALRPERDFGHSAIFQAKIAFHNVPMPKFDIAGLRFEHVPLDVSHVELDLVLHVFRQPEGIRIAFEYRAELFDAATIADHAELLRVVLRAALERPGIRLGDLLAVVAEASKAFAESRRSERLAARRARLGRVDRKTLLSHQPGEA